MPGAIVEVAEGNEGTAATTKVEANGVAANDAPGESGNSPKSSVRQQDHPDNDQQEVAGRDDGADTAETSIEQLYDNVCDMQSSDQSPSRRSFLSDGDESQIDSELRHLVGGEMREVRIMEEEVAENPQDAGCSDSELKRNGSGSSDGIVGKTISTNGKPSNQGSPEGSQIVQNKTAPGKTGNQNRLNLKKGSDRIAPKRKLRKFALAETETASGIPDLGPLLLKQAREMISSGDNLRRALDLALQATKSFEMSANGKFSLDMVMSLHVTAAIYCSLGQYSEAIPILERSIDIPSMEEGQDHALAKFAGHMQLGDTNAILGQLKNSISCYTSGLEVQQQALGAKDPRVGETCRYLAEAHVQAMQFDEARKLCGMALEIHRENGSSTSIEEAADHRLMGLICETKGDHEAALEHLVLASMSMASNGQESEVASVDCSIGDTYLSLARYDEAILAYQKALTAFKSAKGENHPAVASVYVRLADLCNKTGKLRESKSYCESALQIYSKPVPGISPEEIATGLIDVSAIYESTNELDLAMKLLKKALKIYDNAPGQQSTIAGIEAQMGALYYMLGNYGESYCSLKSAILKFRASGEKKSAFFGIALNQMGLACIQRCSINEAAELFEEARTILEQECGPYHPDTLGVYSNLAGTYDAMGRLGDAIEILEYVVEMRENKLGTANPDVDDEKRRLRELLKEAGRVRSRKASSLKNLLSSHPTNNQNHIVEV